MIEAPDSYYNLTPVQKAEICNGAGPRNLGWLVPDTIYLLSITECANVHDYCYHIGKTRADKSAADDLFLKNMLNTIVENTKWSWLKSLRIKRAKLYWTMVMKYGDSAFFSKG